MTAVDKTLLPSEPEAGSPTPRRWRRPGPAVLISGVLVLAAIVLALFGRELAPQSPYVQNLLEASRPSGHGHIFGTDQLGRDILSRTLAGARTAVLGPLAIAVATVVLSTVVGLIGGYIGGWVDNAFGRVADVFYAVPPLVVAIVVVGVLGGGYTLGIIVLSVLNVPSGYRNVRAATLEQKPLPYIESAWVLGRSRWRIMFVHILPNIAQVLLATFFLVFTYGFVDLATLSFLGLGVAPGTPDWGRMVAESRVLVFQNVWAALAPLLLIVITAVSANVLGESLEVSLVSRRRNR
jgi:ABC-type dipeptide/oligopeptide/nickel transport system permease subunit